jgi:hypothetical protein
VVRPRQRSLDLHPDGDSIGMAAVPAAQAVAKRDKVVFIFNFFDGLRRMAQVKKCGEMIDRRERLKDLAVAGGLVFVGCGLARANAQSRSQATTAKHAPEVCYVTC